MRPWHIAQAMKSVRSLDEIIDELTEEELLHILELESGSSRRPSVVKRVFKKAVELNRQNYLAKLKEKFPWLAPNL
jgi:hypothetical protein